MTPLLALLVAAGAAVGAPARYLSVHLVTRLGGSPVLGTLTVNVVGSFALGWVVGSSPAPWLLALLGVGFCGAYTTYSTLALEIWQYLQDQAPLRVSANVVLTLTLGLGAVWAGWALGQS